MIESDMNTPPGTKIRLFCPIEVEEDLLVLSNMNCRVLGGRVEEMVTEWEKKKASPVYTAGRSTVSSNAPPWVPFGVDIEKLGHKIAKNFVSLQSQIENTEPLSEEFAKRRETLISEAMKKMTV
ncbi:unnamed protein product [Soboliphyme baturini]|uniref:RMI1_N domain-containing protein n=1 Tax=Soboliphyme baturini TaxID=241478 RepID=A0A183IZI0_9BILA|nr:unnamed protein product [Soboliphyme baturini]